MTFGENLKQIRLARGMTQKDVYTALSVSCNCYASWEQGRTQPDIDSIKKLCCIYDVTADCLIGLEDEYGSKTHEYFEYFDQFGNRDKTAK